MYPPVEDFVRVRMQTAATLRVLAICLLCIATPAFLWWLAEGIIDGDFFHFFYYSPRIFISLLIVPGLLMLVFANFFSRLLIRINPDPRCPRCRYQVQGSNTDRCPECGIPIPHQLATATHTPPRPLMPNAPLTPDNN